MTSTSYMSWQFQIAKQPGSEMHGNRQTILCFPKVIQSSTTFRQWVLPATISLFHQQSIKSTQQNVLFAHLKIASLQY